MNLLELPVVLTLSFVTALLFGLAAQRLLGIRLGLVRLFIAGIFAMLINWPIQSAMLGDLADGEPTGLDAVPALFFVLLAAACTILASMVFVVLIEAFVPLGSVPPPLVWGRGLRARIARTRRYWQIVGIGLRHGLGPFLRDTRRLGVNVRLFADERDRDVVTDLLHQVLLAFLAATVGIMAVLLLGTGGGPMVTEKVSLYALFGYNLLVVSAVLGLRVLAAIFRRG
jgi:ubiquinone biosynthesis protein